MCLQKINTWQSLLSNALMFEAEFLPSLLLQELNAVLKTPASYFEVIVSSGYRALLTMAFAHLRFGGVGRQLTPSTARRMLPCGGDANPISAYLKVTAF